MGGNKNKKEEDKKKKAIIPGKPSCHNTNENGGGGNNDDDNNNGSGGGNGGGSPRDKKVLTGKGSGYKYTNNNGEDIYEMGAEGNNPNDAIYLEVLYINQQMLMKSNDSGSEEKGMPLIAMPLGGKDPLNTVGLVIPQEKTEELAMPEEYSHCEDAIAYVAI